MSAIRGRMLLPCALAGLLLLAAGADVSRGASGPDGGLGALVERLYKAAAVSGFAREELEYRIEAGPLGLARGEAHLDCRREEIGGRGVLRLTQETVISGRRQVSETLLDAAGLFPYEHTRLITDADGLVHRESILWDHLGGRLFCEARLERDGKPLRILDRQEKLLGAELPADILDPLGALLVYRLRCAAAGKAISWAVPVIEGCDEVYRCVFAPRGGESVEEDPVRGKVPAAVIDQVMTARTPGLAGRTVELTLELGGRFIPRRFSGPMGGSSGTLTLTGSRGE